MPVATKILRAMLICVSLFQPRLAVVMIDQAKRIAVASQLPAAADLGIFDEAPCASRSRNAGSLALRHSSTSASEDWRPSAARLVTARSEEHTSEPQSLKRISYALSCLQQKTYYHRYN